MPKSQKAANHDDLRTTFTTCPTADELNAHIASGGTVQVTTYTLSKLYSQSKRQPDYEWFTQDARGHLYVKRGRSSRDCLTAIPGRLCVSIRLHR